MTTDETPLPANGTSALHVLLNGKFLCYTIQGEHSLAFKLTSNKKLHTNAVFCA